MALKSLGLTPPPGGSTEIIRFVDDKGRLIRTSVTIAMVSMEQDVFQIRFAGKRVVDTVMAFESMYDLPPHWAILGRIDPKKRMVIKQVSWDHMYGKRFAGSQQLGLPGVT